MIELEPIDLKLRIDSWIWMLKLDVKMQHLMVHCDNALYVLNYKVRYPVKILQKQECIPVGCVPAARLPYAGVCFPGEGVYLVPGGVLSLRGVCT